MSDEHSKEEQRLKLEEKYKINLDQNTDIGNKTYLDLYDYFYEEIITYIKDSNLLIPCDLIHMCCHRTDIESMKDEFKKQMKEFIDNDPGPCEDPFEVGCSLINEEVEQPPPYN